jgi:hypothetical protein
MAERVTPKEIRMVAEPRRIQPDLSRGLLGSWA